jgi:hypothetical protein
LVLPAWALQAQARAPWALQLQPLQWPQLPLPLSAAAAAAVLRLTAEQLSEQASQNAADQKGQQHPQQ